MTSLVVKRCDGDLVPCTQSPAHGLTSRQQQECGVVLLASLSAPPYLLCAVRGLMQSGAALCGFPSTAVTLALIKELLMEMGQLLSLYIVLLLPMLLLLLSVLLLSSDAQLLVSLLLLVSASWTRAVLAGFSAELSERMMCACCVLCGCCILRCCGMSCLLSAFDSMAWSGSISTVPCCQSCCSKVLVLLVMLDLGCKQC